MIGFRVQYDLNGQTFEILHGSDKQREKQIPAWVRFLWTVYEPGQNCFKSAHEVKMRLRVPFNIVFS